MEKNEQSKKKRWYKKWWGILILAFIVLYFGSALIVRFTSDPNKRSDTQPSTQNKTEQQAETKKYTVLASQKLGDTTMYYAYTDASYRNKDKLRELSPEIFKDQGQATDYIVRLYDDSLVIDFIRSVPQKDWKREPGGRDDYAWVAQHLYALLTNNSKASTQEVLYYPNGLNGDYEKL